MNAMLDVISGMDDGHIQVELKETGTNEGKKMRSFQ